MKTDESQAGDRSAARPSLSAWPSFFEPFRQVGQAVATLFSPSADASHVDDAYRIRLELPGVEEDDVEVSVHDGVLTISGEKKEEREETDDERRVYFSERSYGAFERAFRIPDTVDQDRIEADFDKGVLTIALPKRADKKSEKKVIDVKRR
ncbi:MAG: Hsp20/alpha crystallin family protein [Marivibrio sp.]|uniref:Hsp20/alpha crystallin family protein n=1 Tax=Marivibrio sp. TaxID=2039719 RepID=UPI0032EC462A